MSLAYMVRSKPRVYFCAVEASDDGNFLWVHTPEKRMRISLRDTFFSDSILETVRAGFTGQIELCGILKSGRTQLRVRIPGVFDLSHKSITAESSWADAGSQTLAAQDADKKAADMLAAKENEIEAADADSETKVLTEPVENFDTACELASDVMGYPIDDFQRRCLAVILKRDTDLLAMAPTGSGKTAVALLAILQAFARGQRAIYTSPIKALSNQKFAEFKQWFRSKGVKGEVTLLTGDIKIRAPPGTKNELIICTSEILRNKLVRSIGTYVGGEVCRAMLAPCSAHAFWSEQNVGQEVVDPDLERLGCVVSDEVHYINDPERGSVWEETLMHLGRHIQLVALSATLRKPEEFVKWIEFARNRPGEIVRRTDRHVPLYFGGMTYTKDVSDSSFVELFCTHGDRAGVFDQSQFHALYPSAAEIQKSIEAAKQQSNQANQAARASRDAEIMHNAMVATGGSAPKKGPAVVSNKPARRPQQGKDLNFEHEVQS
ncbi:hypothetical protein GUITHDRAFT_113609 [Guillardia theta CCMP2712]|uniref:Helicase ATP-binding domain-containing protein n=1 Tax=Guillardia theta (strain CCMP2712) TaxID=905079 RepID=L1IWZ6_GUITC|nr:hypothetical protein GUITHDRAFT_113609 [Guillardia theta CCMP2712]EKX40370.1 hypothetical protein GUITHDRAFT_113609 [Guillardia theta CCMP2712]|eukprot:XP_005827350.1 hypothetical protein GUITHDRAFT_113609 [Guillardia theta CCMP2712]